MSPAQLFDLFPGKGYFAGWKDRYRPRADLGKENVDCIDGILAGDLDEFTEALVAEERRQRLEAAATVG